MFCPPVKPQFRRPQPVARTMQTPPAETHTRVKRVIARSPERMESDRHRTMGPWERRRGSEAMNGRGKLRVYLGAAPGVGKTYHMLDEAQRRAERGGDVVVGFVETHDRPHTAAMLDGLEIVPRRRMEYRGSDFDEMDVDAVLERHPTVVLIDELAHTNIP